MWSVKYNASFLNPQGYIFHFYPSLKAALDKDEDPNCYDILLLGGSVLKSFEFEDELKNGFAGNLKKKIRIYNLAMPAYTSLDSYYEYKNLLNKKFSLVIYYDGINDLFLNNCPLSVFKEDYSHFSWYNEINQFERLGRVNFISLPFTFYCIRAKIREKLNPLEYILSGTNMPRQGWVRYGSDIKTKNSYRENIFKILEIAEKKKEPVVLMTFASYVPENYSLENFNKRLLDYGSYYCPIEIWGSPENIKKGILTNNQTIEDLIQYYTNITFIDQDKLVPKNGNYFDDPCHFSQKGYQEFTSNILDALYKK